MCSFFKYFTLQLVLVVSLLSCGVNGGTDKIEVSFIPDIYPYIDTIYANHHNNVPFFTFGQKKSDKLIFYTYGDCSSCFAKIIEWQNFVKANRDILSGVECALVLYSENVEILEFNLEKIDNSLPVYIDTSKTFSTYNNLPVVDSYMMLLDENNISVYSSANSNYSEKYHLKKLFNSLKYKLN